MISQNTLNTWKKESKTAMNLMKMEGYTAQEEAMIKSAKKEQLFKLIMALILGVSFSASLRRYFPGTLLTESPSIYAATCISIIVPTYTMAHIYTNKEVISKLIVIRENHKILEGKH